jgi:tRNA 2-thiocytidine biosynthesis protein TtcA
VVIRPLIYCAEPTLARFAEERAFPILPCNLCGSQAQAQRKQIKALLARMETEHPQLKQTMLAALGNVVPSHLLDADLVSGARSEASAQTGTAGAWSEGAGAGTTAGEDGRRRLPVA